MAGTLGPSCQGCDANQSLLRVHFLGKCRCTRPWETSFHRLPGCEPFHKAGPPRQAAGGETPTCPSAIAGTSLALQPHSRVWQPHHTATLAAGDRTGHRPNTQVCS